jgi:hypothetical protein
LSQSINEHIAAKRDFGKAVCQRISENIARLGFRVQTELALPEYDAAEFSVVIDPFTQSQDLVGYWYKAGKQRIGQIQFHGDGSFYAEYDVVQPHPAKQHVFVEAINAWGRQDNIKTEAKLLELPRD